MSYKRHQMEKELPEASPRLCNFLWHQLNEAGLSVPQQDIAFIGKLVSAYFNTAEGKATALTYLKTKAVPVSALQTYYQAGFVGQEDKKIRPSLLQRFNGWIYNGNRSVPFEGIDIDDREDASICDNCGGRFPVDYCLKQVEATKQSGQTRTEQWCNHCRYLHDNPKIRQTGDQRKCHDCEKVLCEFHPRHNISLLPPPRAASNDVPMPPGWERP